MFCSLLVESKTVDLVELHLLISELLTQKNRSCGIPQCYREYISSLSENVRRLFVEFWYWVVVLFVESLSLEEDVFYSELVCIATTFSDTEGTTHSCKASLCL